jgi:hypothetical protein
MLITEVLLVCRFGSWDVAGRASVSATGSVKVRWRDDAAEGSAGREPDLLDQVLK